MFFKVFCCPKFVPPFEQKIASLAAGALCIWMTWQRESMLNNSIHRPSHEKESRNTKHIAHTDTYLYIYVYMYLYLWAHNGAGETKPKQNKGKRQKAGTERCWPLILRYPWRAMASLNRVTPSRKADRTGRLSCPCPFHLHIRGKQNGKQKKKKKNYFTFCRCLFLLFALICIYNFYPTKLQAFICRHPDHVPLSILCTKQQKKSKRNRFQKTNSWASWKISDIKTTWLRNHLAFKWAK